MTDDLRAALDELEKVNADFDALCDPKTPITANFEMRSQILQAGMAMAVGKVRRAWAQAQPNK